jgi:hypothetical protein
VKAISQFIVHVFDLIEAEGGAFRAAVRDEGASAREGAMRVASSFAVLLISVPVFISGVWMMGAGLMWWLETQVSRPLSAFITGLTLIIAGAFILFVSRHFRDGAPHA